MNVGTISFSWLPILASFLAAITWAWGFKKRSRKCLPPSPKADPILGHIRLLPAVDEHIAYRTWSEELKSDVISLNMTGQTIIVLNSYEAANDLLVRRASIYSNRPQLTMVRSERLTGWGNNTAFLPYGERWKKQRKMTHDVLNRKASEQYWPSLVKQARLALQRLLDHPSEYHEEFRRMAASTLLSATYGYDVTTADDKLVHIVEEANKGLCEAALSGKFYVNVVPWFQYIPSWFPGAEWRRQADKWRADKNTMLHTPFNWTKDQMAKGTAGSSMLQSLLSGLVLKEEHSDILMEEDFARWTTGTMFSAGSDTSVAVLVVFVLAMAMHGDIQAKAQQEIDKVLGENRLPEMSDRSSLPYVNRLIKEVLRWRTVTSLAVPHSCIQDDNYRGYHIPKGSIVIGNVWAMSQDSKTYPHPEKFDPDRFTDPSLPEASVFGFGRRSCPGVHLAEATLFITISTMLSIFDIQPVRDTSGNTILPSGEMGPNLLVSLPAPFDCVITHRSQKHEQLLRAWVDV